MSEGHIEMHVLGRWAVIDIRRTLRTAQDADTLVNQIRILRSSLTSHREMVAADIGAPDPTPTFHDELVTAGFTLPKDTPHD